MSGNGSNTGAQVSSGTAAPGGANRAPDVSTKVGASTGGVAPVPVAGAPTIANVATGITNPANTAAAVTNAPGTAATVAGALTPGLASAAGRAPAAKSHHAPAAKSHHTPSSRSSAAPAAAKTCNAAPVHLIPFPRKDELKSGHAAAANLSRGKLETRTATDPVKSAPAATSTPVSSSLATKTIENHNNSNLAAPGKATQVPTTTLDKELIFIDPHLADVTSIPRPVSRHYSLGRLMDSDVVVGDRVNRLPDAVLGSLGLMAAGVAERWSGHFGDVFPYDVADWRDSRVALYDSRAHPSAVLGLLRSGNSLCFRRPGQDRTFYKRVEFKRGKYADVVQTETTDDTDDADSTLTDLAQVQFEFTNHGSPLHVDRTGSVEAVNATSQPFANTGPNRDAQLDAETTRAHILGQYRRVNKVYHHTFVRAPESSVWAAQAAPNSFYTLVRQAASQNRDFLEITMPFTSTARLFGFDPSSAKHAQQKAHIRLVSAVIDSYQSCVLDRYPCHVSLAVGNTRGGTKELVSKPFVNSRAIPSGLGKDSRFSHVMHERASLPDPASRTRPSDGILPNRVLFDDERVDGDLDVMDALIGNYYIDADKTIVSDPDHKGSVWIALPTLADAKSKQRWSRTHCMLHFLICTILSDLIRFAPSQEVLKRVFAHKKLGKAARRVLAPFITDNGDEVKVPQVDVTPVASAPAGTLSKKEDNAAKKKKAVSDDDEEEEDVTEISGSEDDDEEEEEEEKRAATDEEEEEDPGSATETAPEEVYSDEEEELAKEAKAKSSKTDEEEDEEEEEEEPEKEEPVIVAEPSATDIEDETANTIFASRAETRKESRAETRKEWQRFASRWSELDDEERAVMELVARYSITNPNKAVDGQPAPRPVIDPFTGQPMTVAVHLDAVKSKEHINGLLEFFDVSKAYLNLDRLSLLFRPRMGVKQLLIELNRADSATASSPQRYSDPFLYAVFETPFNPQIVLNLVFSALHETKCFIPFGYGPDQRDR